MMTVIVMVFEMTRDYAIIVPVIVTVALAAGVRRALVLARRSTPSSCATAVIASPRSGTSISIWSSRRRHHGDRFIVAKAGTAKDAMLPDDIETCIPSWSNGRTHRRHVPPRSRLWLEARTKRLIDYEDEVECGAAVIGIEVYNNDHQNVARIADIASAGTAGRGIRSFRRRIYGIGRPLCRGRNIYSPAPEKLA